MFVADDFVAARHSVGVLSHRELVDSLQRLKDEGKATNAEIGRLLDVPSSRVAEIFTGKRSVKVDEMKALVDHYDLEGKGPTAISEELLTPIVWEIVERARREALPPSPRPLAAALARYIQQIGARPAIHASPDALEAVAHAVIPLSLSDKQPA